VTNQNDSKGKVVNDNNSANKSSGKDDTSDDDKVTRDDNDEPGTQPSINEPELFDDQRKCFLLLSV